MTIQQEAYRLIDGLSESDVRITVEFIRHLSEIGDAKEYALPNRETMEAIMQVSEMKAHPENYKCYDTFQELLDDVMEESGNA